MSDKRDSTLEGLLPIDEHVEEVSENGEQVRHRGIFLLPNLFTTAALFSGFYAIIAAINMDFEAAGLAIFFGLILDGMDGRIARLTNSQSKFGEEYDSLSDLVTFGVAPALIMFMWCLSALGKLGWSMAFIYLVCAALRLARFNAQADTADKRYFTGLASPAAAMFVAATVWLCTELGVLGLELPRAAQLFFGGFTAFAGLLMVSNVRYESFKAIDFKGRVPFVAMFLVTMLFVVIAMDPAAVLFLLSLLYAFSGPIASVWRKLRRKPRDTGGAAA
ncbi:MAG: CDP-diacylglycerol--serine O-phosphatidyltransferase [Pseudomonadales bacterium]